MESGRKEARKEKLVQIVVYIKRDFLTYKHRHKYKRKNTTDIL